MLAVESKQSRTLYVNQNLHETAILYVYQNLLETTMVSLQMTLQNHNRTDPTIGPHNHFSVRFCYTISFCYH